MKRKIGTDLSFFFKTVTVRGIFSEEYLVCTVQIKVVSIYFACLVCTVHIKVVSLFPVDRGVLLRQLRCSGNLYGVYKNCKEK